MNDDQQFYIKTTDGTSFCIYELTFNDESSTISFGYAPVEQIPCDKEEYAAEVEQIVYNIIIDAINNYSCP